MEILIILLKQVLYKLKEKELMLLFLHYHLKLNQLLLLNDDIHQDYLLNEIMSNSLKLLLFHDQQQLKITTEILTKKQILFLPKVIASSRSSSSVN